MLVYEITRTAARRQRIAELRPAAPVLSVQLLRGRLLLGHRGAIVAHALRHDLQHAQPPVCESRQL